MSIACERLEQSCAATSRSAQDQKHFIAVNKTVEAIQYVDLTTFSKGDNIVQLRQANQ